MLVIDNFVDFDPTGNYPNVIHISGDVYAVACEGSASDGYVHTFTVDSAGAIAEPLIDSLEFDAGINVSVMPSMMHISGDYYAIAYQGADNDGWLCTVKISAAGAITDTVVDTLEFDGTAGSNPKIIHISGDIYAIAYTGATDGFLVTVEISTVGVIPATVTDGPWEFDTDRGDNPDIIKVSGTTYAIAYSGTSYAGKLFTLTIANNGTITESAIDTLTFSADNCDDCNIIHVSGDIYAIAHVGGTDLSIVTVEIASTGAIPDAVTDTLIVDTAAVRNRGLSFIHTAGEVYAVAYSGTDYDGYIATIPITTGGQISATVSDSLEFYTADAQFPSVVAISSAVLIVAYNAVGDGDITTISTEIAGEAAGVLAVVETRLHYVDAYGDERWLEGTVI